LVFLAALFSNRFLLCLVKTRKYRLASRFDKCPRRTLARSPRAVPWESTPVGHRHDKPNCRCRRPRMRTCLRKGCGRKYQPRRSNQHYCQDPECLRLVRRWQAAKRQAKRRQDEAVKSEHAEAERARRQRATFLPQEPKPPEVGAARGHAAKIFSPAPMCGRPGCYEPAPKSGRNQACYCCAACRQAVRRVVDRERKWRLRGTFRGRRARELEYQAARARRCPEQHDRARTTPSPSPPV
jgi:hypothetical protein